MSAPTAASLFTTSGKLNYGWYDNSKRGVYRCRSAAFAASATAALALDFPANARILWAQANPSTAVVLSTATRYGVGTTADPDAVLISGTTVTAGTTVGPVPYISGIPIFTNQIVGTTGTAAGSALTLSTFSGQTVAPIPANFLKPGDIIRMRGSGTLVQGGSSTFTLKVLSGTDIALQSGAPVVVTGDHFSFDCDMTVTAIGTSGKFYSSGRSWVGTGSAAAGAADIPTSSFLTTTTLDTTAAFTPSVTGTFSASDSSTAIMNQFTIEVIRPQLPVSASATTLVVTALSNAGVSAGTGTTGVVDVEIHFELMQGIATA